MANYFSVRAQMYEKAGEHLTKLRKNTLLQNASQDLQLLQRYKNLAAKSKIGKKYMAKEEKQRMESIFFDAMEILAIEQIW